jgi:hypothetical protein
MIHTKWLGVAYKRCASIAASDSSLRSHDFLLQVEGLGAAPVKTHEHIGPKKSLVERELERMVRRAAIGPTVMDDES